jgi:uncharacterized protein YukE
MSPKEMRTRADECERLADSLAPILDDLSKMLRDIAEKWRRLADDAESHQSAHVARLGVLRTGLNSALMGFQCSS